MLEQVVQVAAEATKASIPWFDVGIIALAIKAVDSLGSLVLKMLQSRARARAAASDAEIEEERTIQLALKKKNGQDTPSLIAFCPGHIGMVERITTVETETKHINQTLGKIEGHLEYIRGQVGK